MAPKVSPRPESEKRIATEGTENTEGHSRNQWSERPKTMPGKRIQARATFAPTPKALRHKAQGCRAAATLGFGRLETGTPTGVLPSLRESERPIGLRAVSVSPLAEPLRGSCALSIFHPQGSRSRGNPGLYDITPSAYSKFAQRDKNRTVSNTEGKRRRNRLSEIRWRSLRRLSVPSVSTVAKTA